MAKKYKYSKSFTFEGQRYFIRGDSLEEVYRKMAEKKHQLENALVIYDSKMPLKVWADAAIDTYKSGLSDASLYDVKTRIKKHIIPELGNIPIGRIRPAQCQQLINKKAGFSKEYINKISQDLNFLFEKAVENDMIQKNPAAHIVKPKGHVTHRRSITDHERKHLLLACEKDDRFLPFLFMLQCGCRPFEALLIVHNDLQKKGGVPFLHIRGTKTENSDRFVPLPPDLLARIPKGNPFDLVFKDRHGRRYNKSSYGSLTKALRREMNISMGCRVYRNALVPPYPLADDFVPYNLRHTYCTDLQKAGVDIRTAQKLMGHADIQTTANIYTHQDEDLLLEAAKLLNCRQGATGGATPKCKNW